MNLENLGLIIVVGLYFLWTIGYCFFQYNEELMDDKSLDEKYYKPKFFLGLTISLTVWSLLMYWLFG
jgi:hypothetical protein